jgi:polysaccharide pyruvyl transferase CsaB
MVKQNAVVIAGYYGFGNAGDELILHSLVARIRRQDPEPTITVLSRRPEQTRRDFNVLAVNRWLPWSWIAPLASAREFWLGGGGLLQESTGPWNYAYYLGLLLLAKVLRCRTVVRAIGIDPPKSAFNRALTRWTLEHAADEVSVRDDESHRALRKLGVQRFLDVVQDPIFDLEPPSVPVQPKRIGLSIVAWPAQASWVSDVAALCDLLAERLGVTVELFAFFPDQEDPLIRSVAQKCRRPVIYEPSVKPQELPDCIARCSVVIGMRYHALALAVLAGRPFIGWGYQRKVRSLCRQFNRPFRSFEQVWNPELILQEIEKVYATAPI